MIDMTTSSEGMARMTRIFAAFEHASAPAMIREWTSARIAVAPTGLAAHHIRGAWRQSWEKN